jgi:Ras-related protein Rab-7A
MSSKRTLLKIIILGDSAVGKTSLMNQYVNNKFSSHYKVTIGADFLSKDVDIDDRIVTLQIWDTAGQERFQSLGVAFYRGADAVMLVYDLTNAKTFENLKDWREEFLHQANPKGADSFPFIVVGNKKDLDKERHVVPKKRAKAFCEKLSMPHFRASAKDGSNVEKSFATLVKLALERQHEEEVYIPETLDLKDEGREGDACPC